MEHYKIKLNGIGLHCGKGVIVDIGNKLHGDVFNEAYAVGEDICDGGNILVSTTVRKKMIDKEVDKQNLFENVILEPYIEDEEKDPIAYTLSGEFKDLKYSIVEANDDRHLHKNLIRLTNRHNPNIKDSTDQ